MTDDELKTLVASLSIAQKETGKQIKETGKQLTKTDKQLTQTDRQLKKTDRQLKETDKLLKESIRETGKQIKELGKQIGGLGKKFGSFTEGLALPSMTKILREQFQMEVISPSVRVSRNGKDAEIDVLAYSNSAVNKAYVVEVKSHLREEGINQLKEIMENFRMFFPEHKDKRIYGIIAVVDVSEALKKRVLRAGFYVARIKDETFTLDTPEGFKPKVF